MRSSGGDCRNDGCDDRSGGGGSDVWLVVVVAGGVVIFAVVAVVIVVVVVVVVVVMMRRLSSCPPPDVEPPASRLRASASVTARQRERFMHRRHHTFHRTITPDTITPTESIDDPTTSVALHSLAQPPPSPFALATPPRLPSFPELPMSSLHVPTAKEVRAHELRKAAAS